LFYRRRFLDVWHWIDIEMQCFFYLIYAIILLGNIQCHSRRVVYAHLRDSLAYVTRYSHV
jgi:hypothetical protein